MPQRLIATFICTWALQGMPVACAAGWIWHLCIIGCGCEHEESAEPVHNGCGHEQDCPDDPCFGLSVGGERQVRLDEFAAPVVLDAFLIAPSCEPDGEIQRRTLASNSRAAPNRPFPPSDVPLLI